MDASLLRQFFWNRTVGLLIVALLLLGVFGCQELPTEPTPIDLSKEEPLAKDDDAATPEETLLKIDVLKNDSSLVGDDLTVTAIVTPPVFGTAEIDGNMIEYTPQVDYNGSDSLRYRVSGGILAATAKVVITVTPVNDPPEAVDDVFSVSETIAVPKGQLVALDVLANDSDVDGDVLRVIRTSTPTRGTVQIASDGSSISYEPFTNSTGNDQFTYTISDGNGGQDIATVSISIQPVNDPPTVTPKTYATDEDEPRAQAAPGVLDGASDPENDVLTAVLIADVSHGDLMLNADGSFLYTPAPNYHGSDSFVFAASDGMSQSAPASAVLNILAQNDPPEAADDSYETQEDVPIIVDAPGILSNDLDVDGDPLTITVVTSTANGTLDLDQDGSFTYEPVSGFSGMDGFVYQIDDGSLAAQAVVTIVVGAVNDAPVASPDQYDVAANVELVVTMPGVLENDTDEDGDELSAVLVTSPDGLLNLAADGGFTYQPAPGYFGTDSFEYRASDGVNLSDVVKATILVTATGTPPIAFEDAYTVSAAETLEVAAPGILDNDTDDDGDELVAVLVSEPAEGMLQLEQDGSFVYDPRDDFQGVVTFTYRASDGANVSQITIVTITVDP